MPDKIYDLRPLEWLDKRSEHYFDYADSYRVACRILLDLECQEKGTYSEKDILPILSLFRQYVELQLKGLILEVKEKQNFCSIKHDLEKLLSTVKKSNAEFKISSDVEHFILFLNNFDKSGDSFRYPEDLRGNMFFKDLGKYAKEIGRLSILYPKIYKTIYELETAESILRLKSIKN